MRRLVWLALFIGIFSSVAAWAESMQSVRRYTIVAAANDGGFGRVKLRYAHSDARQVAGVFTELGGVSTEDQQVLIEPTPAELLAALKSVVRGVAQLPARTELVFYYSGHSDEQGLLLKGQRLGYQELRKALLATGVDVRVAVLDSCASGAFTRLKGGQRKPPFVVDASSDVKGYAFLTSSSSTEAAQESDNVRGSFFTHYFLSALRGAGDVTGDHRVTLNEAYQFAFHETLARTENTLSGAQHAAYDIQLAGAGDLVLTDLRLTNATLRLGPDIQGHLFVRDAQNNLVVEFYKKEPQAMDLALAPQRYRVSLERDGQWLRSQIHLSKDGPTMLSVNDFEVVKPEQTVQRGGEVAQVDYQDIRFKISLAPDVAVYIPPLQEGRWERVAFELNLLAGSTDYIKGASYGPFVSHVQDRVEGAQIAGIASINHGSLKGSQVSAVANANYGGIDGAQVAAAVNYAEQGGKGAQVGGVLNITRGFWQGAQVAGGVNVAQSDGEGAQVAGVANISSGHWKGAQVAGVVNVKHDKMEGAQVAGVVNVARLGGEGAQVGGVVNVAADSLRGVQIAGVVNVAQQIPFGGQIGLINVASQITGFQLGLINVSNDINGVPVGFLSFVRNGRLDFGIVANRDAEPMLYMKTGSRYIYNVLGVSMHENYEVPTQSDRSVVWGIGGSLPLSERFYLDVDTRVALQQSQYGGYCLSCEIEQQMEAASRGDTNTQRCFLCDDFTPVYSLNFTAGFSLEYDFDLVFGFALNARQGEITRKLAGSQPETVTRNNEVWSFWPALFVGLEY